MKAVQGLFAPFPTILFSVFPAQFSLFSNLEFTDVCVPLKRVVEQNKPVFFKGIDQSLFLREYSGNRRLSIEQYDDMNENHQNHIISHDTNIKNDITYAFQLM